MKKNKMMKSKQGKVFIVFVAIFILIAIILLMIANNKIDKSIGSFGARQKQMIQIINEKDKFSLYLQDSADIALKNTIQQKLADNLGRFTDKNAQTNIKNITGCESHIYPLLSKKTGELCKLSETYETQYIKEFEKNMRNIKSKSYFILNNIIMADYDIFIKDGNIYGIKYKGNGIEIPLMSDDNFLNFLIRPNYIINKDNIPMGKGAKELANQIKVLESSAIPNLVNGDSSKFIQELLEIIYLQNKNKQQIIQDLYFPNYPWVIAAKYVSEPAEQVVYAGEGIDYCRLVSLIYTGILEKGDLVFTSSKIDWCKWTGQNRYDLLEGNSIINRCNMIGNLYRPTPEIGFCKQGSINLEKSYPDYCSFNESNIIINKFPIVTHMFIYLGVENNEYVVANFESDTAKGINYRLIDVLNPEYNDGARIIIRPDYPKI